MKPHIGQHYDALMHSGVIRSLPRYTVSAEESASGPRRWWHNGDTCVGIACFALGIWACVQTLMEVL